VHLPFFHPTVSQGGKTTDVLQIAQTVLLASPILFMALHGLFRYLLYAQRQIAATRLSVRLFCVAGSDSILATERVVVQLVSSPWCL
jgi:hypothetical protein